MLSRTFWYYVIVGFFEIADTSWKLTLLKKSALVRRIGDAMDLKKLEYFSYAVIVLRGARGPRPPKNYHGPFAGPPIFLKGAKL